MCQNNGLVRSLIGKHIFDVSRDNARTPMQWDDSEYFGFSSVKPWLNGTSDNKDRNVKEELNDQNSLFNFYKKMIAVRKNYPVVVEGKFELLYKNNPNLFIYTRTLEDKQLLVICSFSKNDVKCPIKDFNGYNLLLTNYKEQKDKFMPFECRVYLKEK